MKEMTQYIVKAAGLDQPTLFVFGLPLGIFFSQIEEGASKIGMSVLLVKVLIVLFLFDMAFGVIGAIKKKEFSWTKFWSIGSKTFLLAFIIGLAIIFTLAKKEGYDFAIIDVGDDAIICIAILQHLKSALENTKKIGKSDVVDFLLSVLKKFDGIVNFKKEKDGK